MKSIKRHQESNGVNSKENRIKPLSNLQEKLIDIQFSEFEIYGWTLVIYVSIQSFDVDLLTFLSFFRLYQWKALTECHDCYE